MKTIKIISFLIIICYLLISCELTKKNQPKKLSDSGIVKDEELPFCDILKSLSNKISSTPYDTYRGTPYLVSEKESNEFSTIFKYYEDYPEYDEFGSINGGKITLSRLIFFEELKESNMTIMSINDTILINGTSKFINKYDKYFIINFNDYFGGDPFYLDKIDFTVKINTNYTGKKPVLIGVYWDNLDDYYKSVKCDNGY